jgi:putative ABC transport system permease protein
MTAESQPPGGKDSGRSTGRRLRRFAFGTDGRRQVDMELETHIEHSATDLVAAGFEPAAAREEARRRFGSVAEYREACYEIDRRLARRRRRSEIGGSLMQDLRLAARGLARSPGFVAAAVLTLLLGLGANLAVFAVVYGVLLKPLPFPQPDRLVMLWEKNPDKGWTAETAAPANFLDWREPNKAFVDITAYLGPFLTPWTGNGEPRAVNRAIVVGNFCSVLGIQPVLGRGFLMEETWRPHRVALVSYAFWREQLGGDPHVLGRVLRLDESPVTIVGVMPRGFSYPFPDLDLWTAMHWDPAERSQIGFRRAHNLRPIGRLRPGVSLAQAQSYLEATAARLEALHPETNRHMGAGLSPLHDWWVGTQRSALLLLFGAVGLVLLIACANVANLQLARSAARAPELAVRQALGAGKGRLARQLLTESVLVAAIAGAVALLTAEWVIRALLALAPAGLPRGAEVGLHLPVLAFAVAATLVAAALFGVGPAVVGMRTSATLALERQRAGTTGRGARRAREALIVFEVALATALVLGAGLLVRNYLGLHQIDAGFRADHVLVARLTLPEKRYPDAAAAGFYRELLGRTAALPGVDAAALAVDLPPLESYGTSDFSIEGRPPGSVGREFTYRVVTPDYFRVVRVPLRRGRVFTDHDDGKAPPTVLINDSLARRYFGDVDPVGHRLAFEQHPTPKSTWFSIVGVVGDERTRGISAPAPAQIYLAMAQSLDTSFFVVLRTAGEPLAMAPALRRAVRSLDPNLPLLSLVSLDQMVDRSLASERFVTLLMGGFGLIALALAAVGIGSLMSYAVVQRTREFGIRIALGAAAQQVLGRSVRQALWLGSLGIALGSAVALSFSRLLQGMLYSTSATDPSTYAPVALFLLAVAVGAAYLPARRILAIDPATALRRE